MRALENDVHALAQGIVCALEERSSNGRERSRGAFCLRMLRRKYFDVSNRWYTPALRVRKPSQIEKWRTNFSALEVVFSFSLYNLCKRVKNQSNGFLESRRKYQPSPF